MPEAAEPLVTTAVDRLRAALADVKVSLADELIEQRRREASAEDDDSTK